MSLTARRDGRVAIVAVRGELDLATAPLLERTLAKLVDDQSCHSIVIDLRDLDFMGSAGLAVLLDAQDHARRRGGEIVLARPSSAVVKTIHIAGLRSTFTIDTDAPPDSHATSP
jgi:anti-sigma B factor antagonist